MPEQNPETAKVGARLPWVFAIAVAAGLGWFSSASAGEPYAARIGMSVGYVLFGFGISGAVLWWKKRTRVFIPPAMVILALVSAFGSRLDSSPSPSDSPYQGGVTLGHTMAEDDSLAGPAEVSDVHRIGDQTFWYAIRESPTGLYQIGSLYGSQGGRQDSSFLVFFYRNDLAPLAHEEIRLTLEQFGGEWEGVFPWKWRKEVTSGSNGTEVWSSTLEKEGRQLAFSKDREFAEFLTVHLEAGVPFGKMGAAWPGGGA